jgi:ribosome-associated translation inhibitor RaiA
MNLNEIEVMGRKLPVKFVTKEELNQMIQNAEGIWDTYERTIFISKDAPVKIQLYYCYHEAGHAVMTFTGLDQIIAPDLQEVIVQSFATLIEDLMRQADKFKQKRTRRKKQTK